MKAAFSFPAGPCASINWICKARREAGERREIWKTLKETLIPENEISGFLPDLFIWIHSNLGPGLLESAYEEVIC
jgi:hypothetical protein